MAGKEYDLGDGGYTMPATESIDESLARLARQDARRTADGGFSLATDETAPTALQALRGRTPSVDRLRRTPPPPSALPPGWGTVQPPSAPSHSAGSGMPSTTTRPGRDVGLTIVRWIIILAVTWFIWRYFIR